MRLEFQREALKFLAQNKEGRAYLHTVQADLFDDGHDYLAYCIVQSFYKHYGYQGTEIELLELLDQDSKEKNVSDQIHKEVEKSIRNSFKTLESSPRVIKEKLIEQYQTKLIKDLFKEKASKIGKDSEGSADALFREISRIKKLGDLDLESKESNRGRFLLQDHEIGLRTRTVAFPTFLHQLNRLTTSRGFKTPELQVFMSGPKRFKTGVALALGVNYARDGLKVFYADTENGHEAITDRANQTMLGVDFQELISGKYDDILNEQVERYKAFGGDFKPHYFPAKISSLADVRDELDFLKEEYNWIPNVIIWDNIDNFIPSTPEGRKRDRRLQIQECYFEAIALQNELQCFGITLSQVTREASSKRVLDERDFAEDFGKAANCHGAFAICQDEYEKKAKVARICPVIQRQGVDASSGLACYIRMDKAKHIIEEITYDEWKSEVEAYEGESPTKKGKRPNLASLKDR